MGRLRGTHRNLLSTAVVRTHQHLQCSCHLFRVPSRSRVRLPPPAPSDATGVRGPDRTSFINAVAVRSSTGFCSFSPAPVGIQAGQAISPSGRRGLGSRAVQPPGGLAQSAEQAAHNGPVPGSSPRSPTSRKAIKRFSLKSTTERRHIP